MRLDIIPAALAALTLSACSAEPAKTNTEAVKQQILAQEEAWGRAYAARDGEALAGFYANDAALAAPGEQLVRGRDALREATAGIVKDPNLSMVFRANRIEVADSGDLAYTRGQFMMTITDPATKRPQSSRGYYLTVWQKQADGNWKAVEDFITPGPALPVQERATMIL